MTVAAGRPRTGTSSLRHPAADQAQLRSAPGGNRASAPPTDHNDTRREEPGLDDLLARVAGGDEAAFADLYDTISGRVYGVALAVVRDPAQAEEVAQEALLEVWRAAGRFDAERGSAMAYILTITHRRAVDVVRREQSARSREHRAAALPEAPYDAVIAAVSNRCERDQVRESLGALTALQQEALALAYYDGHTYAEVAAMLGVKPTTVKARIRDGLLRLRAELADVDRESAPSQHHQTSFKPG